MPRFSEDGTLLLRPVHPLACVKREPYVIVEKTPNGLQLVETHMTVTAAAHFCEVLNTHETKHGREANYSFFYAPEEEFRNAYDGRTDAELAS